MTGSRKRYIFFVGLSPHKQDGLDTRLMRSGISLEYFCAAGPCREALGTRPCHLLVLSLDGDAAEGLQLLGDSERMPKLVLVDHGDIPTAVQAIKAGAATCLERPVNNERLFAEITAFLREVNQNDHPLESTLTPTETTVLYLLLEGKTNYETARALHRSPRTIEVHRSHIMHELGVSNMVELVKMTSSMGFLETRSGEPPRCAKHHDTQ